MARCRGLLIVGLLMLLASACTGSVEFSFGAQSPAEAAVDLIEGDEMAQRLMLDSIVDAVCEDPPNNDEGTVFPCTATSQDKTVEFDVRIDAEDRIFAGPTNVVSATFLDQYETGAAQALNDENGFALESDSIDCGTTSVVLDEARQMPCTLTDGDQIFDVVMTVTDTNRGTFNVKIVSLAE